MRPPLHVAWVFPGFGVGGAQVRFASLANWLGDRFRHSVLSLNGDLACREKLRPTLDVAFPDAGHRAGRTLHAATNARRRLRALRPDLVVTSNWGAIEWAAGTKLAGLRHLHTEDGFGPEERTRQVPRRVWTRRLVLRGSTVVLPSRRLLGIATETWRLPRGRLRYLPNGVDLQRFAGAAPVPPPPGEGPLIGTVAALRPEKNIGRLLRAFAALRARRPARLAIVGDGPERAALERLAATLGIAGDLTFGGHSTQTERWLAAFDVFALSSDTEQMPLSLLEAMAAGLPAVSTDVGDVRAMLPKESAPYVTALSDEALAEALTALLDADRQTIGAANRARAARDYDEQAMFAAWELLLLDLSYGRHSPGPPGR